MPVQRGWLFNLKMSRDDSATRGAEVPVGADQGRQSEGATLEYIPLDRVSPNPFQPRHLADDDPALQELAASIRRHGLLQPILVTRTGDSYALVAGERRWRAAALAGLSAVPALVGEFSRQEMAENALIENLQRRDLNCLEEAEAYQRLINEFGLTQDALAERLGCSQPSVANKLRLLRLPEGIRQSISREMISEGHARALLALDSAELQNLAHDEVVRRSLSVRETEELVRGMAEGGRRGRRRPRRQVVRVFKDARLFRNSLLALVAQMRRGGAAIEVEERSGTGFYEARVRLERKPDGEGSRRPPQGDGAPEAGGPAEE